MPAGGGEGAAARAGPPGAVVRACAVPGAGRAGSGGGAGAVPGAVNGAGSGALSRAESGSVSTVRECLLSG